jgi:hypothetical protein
MEETKSYLAHGIMMEYVPYHQFASWLRIVDSEDITEIVYEC